MNFKKFISGVSALTIAASAFAGMAVAANAEDVSLYSEDFSTLTTEDIATNIKLPTDTGTYAAEVVINNGKLQFNNVKKGTKFRDLTANFFLDAEDRATSENMTANAAKLTFDLTGMWAGNNGYGKSGNTSATTTFYVFPNGVTETPNNNNTPGEYLFAIQAKDVADGSSVHGERTIKILSGSAAIPLFYAPQGDTTGNDTGNYGYGITFSGYNTCAVSSISVEADMDFIAGTASIKINDQDAGDVNLYTTTKTGISGFGFHGGNAYGGLHLDNISITTGDPDDIQTADYTVEYKLGETVVKSTTTTGATVGSVPTANTDTFTEGGQKYYCTGSNAGDLTVAADGSTVVTITVRQAETYTVTPKSSLGDKTFASIDVVEGESDTYYYPRYYVTEAKKLAKSDTGSFSKTVSPTASGNDTVAYTVQNVDVFQFEEMADNTAPAAYPEALSNGKFQNIGQVETNVMTVAADGTYTVEFVMGSTRAATTTNTLTLKVNGTELITNATAAWSPFVSKTGVKLHAGDVISAVGNNDRICLDYVLITKTGDATTEDAFTFTQPLSALQDLMMYVTRSSDGSTAAPVAVSSFGSLDGTTVYSGTGDANLAIIFENIRESWGTLSVVLK